MRWLVVLNTTIIKKITVGEEMIKRRPERIFRSGLLFFKMMRRNHLPVFLFLDAYLHREHYFCHES